MNSIAIIGHNNCGMVDLTAKKKQYVRGLVEKARWKRDRAEDHFMLYAPKLEIGNEIDYVLNETKQLRIRYPSIQVVPLLYQVEDNLLYIIDENDSTKLRR